MRICRPDSGLEALLSDDLIQTMMRADNVDPYDIRALFNKLGRHRRHVRVMQPVQPRAASRQGSCRFPRSAWICASPADTSAVSARLPAMRLPCHTDRGLAESASSLVRRHATSRLQSNFVPTSYFAVLRRLFPRSVLTTELVGKAMLAVARVGPSNATLDPRGNKLSPLASYR